MSHNSFGHLFRVTTWGESHGPALGCVVDGCPPGIPLAEADIQTWLDKRRPGQGRFVDQRSRDYADLATRFRPGHADYAYFAKYGVRDYRGGGRQSARETAARVAAGAIARKVIEGVSIRGAVVQIGPHAVDPARIDWSATSDNPFWAPDPAIVPVWEEHL